MAEWPKAHDWKSCVPQGTEGSNPSLSSESPLPTAAGCGKRSASRAAERWRTPPGPEGSNGNRPTGCSGHYLFFCAARGAMADVVYLVQDMLFTSKIREAAKAVGLTVQAPRQPAALEALSALAGEPATKSVRSVGCIDHE